MSFAIRRSLRPVCRSLANCLAPANAQTTQLVTVAQMHHGVRPVSSDNLIPPSMLDPKTVTDVGCRTATMKDKNEIVDYVCQMFLNREPLMRALNATEADAKPYVEYQVKEALQHNASFVAFDQRGKICGIRLNAVGPASDEIKKMDFGKKMNILEKFLEHVEGDITERVETTRIMRHIAICVNPEIVRSGIGTMMMQKSVDYARSHGLRYMMATCSGKIATKLALKMGFRVVRQIPYESYVDSDSHFAYFPDDCLVNPTFRPFASVAKEHFSAKLLIKNVL